MSETERKDIAIDIYVNLMRIKAGMPEGQENKELEYQIRIAKVKLQNFGIDIADLAI